MLIFFVFLSCFRLQTADTGSSQIRVRVLKGKSLAKKDIFGASDPYVRIDLNSITGDVHIDSVLTKTKKKVSNELLMILFKINEKYFYNFLDTQSRME